MARVVAKSVRGTRYVQVVEDYKDLAGGWRQKVLKSFGPETPETHMEAVQFAAAANEFKRQAEARRGSPEWGPWETAAVLALGAIAVGWMLTALFDD